jgi:2-dehydro-3-deoxygluconokinase
MPRHDARGFDVICAGEALWRLTGREREPAAGAALRLLPGGGAVSAALVLARQELRVGLATVVPDDRYGRALVAKVAGRGVDVGGVELARPRSGLVFVRGGARQVVPVGEEEQPVSVPEGWSSRVLLLSGMSPVLAHAASLCKAARAARRAGTVVVVDVNAPWQLWQGHDSRAIRMILREADVVWCGVEDLFGLKMDSATLHGALRPKAVLVVGDGAGGATATGPFGEVARAAEAGAGGRAPAAGAAFAAAICGELARGAQAGDGAAAPWVRALERGRAAAARAE